MIKRVISFFTAVLIFTAFSVCASAHEVPDENRLGSITVTVIYNEKPVSGGTLTIYKVGDVVSENGNYGFAFTEDFAECEVPITELNSAELPAALAKIAREKRLEGVTEKINTEGKVTFSGLEIGLYLAVQNQGAYGFSKISPFLVSVPYNENGHYIYDVDASPKIDIEFKPDVPDEPDEPDEPEDELPDTGLMNWPVPVMAAAGTVFFCIGIALKISGKRNKNED